jgi:hypothetical protein
MVKEMKIESVKGLVLSNHILHIDYCRIDSLAINKLTQGDWQSLASLHMRSNIFTKS